MTFALQRVIAVGRMVVVTMAICIAGCADLKVQVDIINPAHVSGKVEDFRVQRAFEKIRGSSPRETQDAVADLQARHREAFQKLASTYDEAAARESDPTNKSILSRSGDSLRRTVASGGRLFTLFDQFRSDLLQLDEQIRGEAVKPGEVTPDGSLSFALQNLVRTRLQRDAAFRADRENEMREAALSSPDPNAGDSPQVQNAVAALRSPIGAGSLLRSDYAYFVASAPETDWEERFNSASGSGRLGNSDIAIKLGADGEFSVKGLTFDPSAVAAVASKVATQSLLVAAQVSGVPVRTSTSPGGTATPGVAATGDSAAATADAQVAARDEALAAQRKAVLDLALAVLHEESALGDDNKRDDARKAIRASFDALRPILSLSGFR